MRGKKQTWVQWAYRKPWGTLILAERSATKREAEEACQEIEKVVRVKVTRTVEEVPRGK